MEQKRTAEQVIEELDRRTREAGHELVQAELARLSATAVVADMLGLDPLATVALELGIVQHRRPGALTGGG